MAYRKQIYRILAAFFVLLLVVPGFGILREKRNIELIADMENRTINPRPHSAFATKMFFREFQNWFEDRILGRKDMIRFWSNVNGKLFHVLISREIAMGKNGYLFYPSNVVDKMSDREEKLEQLAGIKKLCDTYHASFVFYMVPHGEWMLPELLPERQKPADVAKLEKELAEELQKRGIDYCMFGQKMLGLSAEERQTMYVKGDYHWNGKGAFWGARELLHHLKLSQLIDGPGLIEVEEETVGEVYTRKIGWDPIKTIANVPWSSAFTENFTVVAYEGGERVSGEGNGQKGEIVVTNPKASHKIRMLVLGDSFYGSLEKYLMQDIDTIIFSHNMDIRNPKKAIDLQWMIETYKPDIVVYEKMGGILFGNGYRENFGKWVLK